MVAYITNPLPINLYQKQNSKRTREWENFLQFFSKKFSLETKFKNKNAIALERARSWRRIEGRSKVRGQNGST